MLTLGQVISYVLSEKDNPTNPTRLYHGVVTAIAPQTPYVHVIVLNTPHAGLEEWVSFSQIRETLRAKERAKRFDKSGFC